MIMKGYMLPHPPIILPEIGKGEESKCLKTLDAYHQAANEIQSLKPDTIIICSPHALLYSDWFNISSGSEAWGDFSTYHCPQVIEHVNYDTTFIETFEHLIPADFPAGTAYDREPMLDHGTMVPLYFLKDLLPKTKIVRVSLSGLSLPQHYQFGMYLARTAERLKRRVVVIASGDLSHCQKKDGPYGYRAEGVMYDEKIMHTMGTGSFGELFTYEPSFLQAAMECGHRSFTIMAGMFDRISVETKVYSHEAPFGVGYGIISFTPIKKDDSRAFLDKYERAEILEYEQRYKKADEYAKLAYETVNAYVLHKPLPSPSCALSNKAAVFVSIHKYGALRGCIGTLAPCEETVGEEIIRNAISACSKDPRFKPITTDELLYLSISVDVLSEPYPVFSINDLDCKKYGVICSTRDGRRGVLLPDIDGVDTVEEQLDIACQKGSIDRINEDVLMQRFEVIRHV